MVRKLSVSPVFSSVSLFFLSLHCHALLNVGPEYEQKRPHEAQYRRAHD